MIKEKNAAAHAKKPHGAEQRDHSSDSTYPIFVNDVDVGTAEMF